MSLGFPPFSENLQIDPAEQGLQVDPSLLFGGLGLLAVALLLSHESPKAKKQRRVKEQIRRLEQQIDELKAKL